MQPIFAQSDAGLSPVQTVTDAFTSIVEAVLAQLPQLALAVVVIVAFILIARLVSKLVRSAITSTSTRSASFVNVMTRLARIFTIAFGVVMALVIAIPSVDLAAVIGGLGVSSVAIGFAFKDILQNTLAGLLLLFRQPFEINDQIEVSGWRGTVEAINIRETQLKQFDGQRVLIPNQDVYGSAVRVQTAYEFIRTDIAVGVDYDADLGQAQQVALDAVAAVEGVESDPAPQALYTQLNTSTIDFDLRYWSHSRQADIRDVQSDVVKAITNALNDAGIAMPCDIIELDARQTFREAVGAAGASQAS
ncbi:mechanosensitive ion channel family protein [Euzebya tangerina]|uniref:mechanosensitive ion channel family protein n=1 Tax=Euzebya tangerina TaxID=591198 RepID=UPI0013C2E233|nr:mechanosensitive ion channel family protein [Euzebya tangerina]